MNKTAAALMSALILFSAGCIDGNNGKTPEKPAPQSVASQKEAAGNGGASGISLSCGAEKKNGYVRTVYMDDRIGLAFGTMDIPKDWNPKADTVWNAENPSVMYQFRAESPDKSEGVTITSEMPMGNKKIVPRQIISNIIGQFEKDGFKVSIADDRDMDVSEFEKENLKRADEMSKLGMPVSDKGECLGAETYLRLEKDGMETFALCRVPVLRGPAVNMPEINIPGHSYGGKTSYYTAYVFSIMGKKGREELKKELEGFRASIRINQGWLQVCSAFITDATNSNMERSQRITEKFIDMSNQQAEDMRALNQSVSDSNDRINHMRSQQLREVKTVTSPFTGRQIEVDAFPDYTYETSDGSIIQTNVKLHE